MDYETLVLSWVAVIAVGLIVFSVIRIARSNGAPPLTLEEEEKQARLPMAILFLIIWGYLSWWVISGNFQNSVRMPWG